jgi:hypothetical protein
MDTNELEEPQPPKRTIGELVGQAIQSQIENNELEKLWAVGEDAPMAQRIIAKIRLKQLGYE